MNLAFFARFSKTRKTNKVFQTLRDVKRHAIFRGARVDLYTPTLHPEKLVILLGQMHTVWKGKIGNRQRNAIVRCQARLCSYYAFFEQFFGIHTFGGEGMYDGLETSFQDSKSFQLYDQVESFLNIKHPVPLEKISQVARDILEHIGKLWHDELRRQADLREIQRYSAAVSGQTLFNFLNNGKIKAYPIEGEGAYQHVLQGINTLGKQIEKLEKTPSMRYVLQRGGKAKNAEEAEAVKQYNALVKKFNKLIGSDIRERATLEILREKAQSEPLVIFTMGVAHRKNYLKLANEYFKGTKTAFVFITAPELLINWWLAIGLPLLLLAALLGLGFWLEGI